MTVEQELFSEDDFVGGESAPTLNDDARNTVIHKLVTYQTKLEQLQQIASTVASSGSARTEANELLQALNDRLKEDCTDLQNRKRELNYYERVYLDHALTRAGWIVSSCGMRSPDKWHESLDRAKQEIAATLNHLAENVESDCNLTLALEDVRRSVFWLIDNAKTPKRALEVLGDFFDGVHRMDFRILVDSEYR